MLMHTYTGKQINPLAITQEDIEIKYIAHALSLLCRGGGHLKYFYSVAQHSLNCAHEAKARGYSNQVILACLLHDASEAYISDIIRPVKAYLPQYIEIESSIMDAIFQKYGLAFLSEEEHALWKQIDNDLLAHELIYFMSEKSDYDLPVLHTTPSFQKQEHEDVYHMFINQFDQLI